MVRNRNRPNIIIRVIALLAAVLLGLPPASALAADMIDVSSWQTGITVTTTGAQIVVAKATEGTTYVNPDCDRVVQQALAAGQGVGVYHFANTANSPQAEAEWFNRNTEGYIGRGIVPILDWEPSQPWNVQWAAQWVDAVRARWNTIPIIYMNQSTENSYDWSPLVQRNVGLWVAAYTLGYTPIYGFNPPSRQPVLQNWPFAVAWQYTSSGHVNGYSGNLDLSVVYGDLETWYAYAGSRPDGTVNPTPAPEPAPEPAPQPSTGSCGPDCRVVQSGQYVSMFWPDWWNVSVPSGNPSLVFPGDTVCHNGGVSSAGNGGRTVTVRPGDTLSGIAARLGINWTQLTGYRSGNPDLIYPGEVLHY